MIRKLLFLLWLLLSFSILEAQIDYSFSGYAINFPIYSIVPKTLADFSNSKQNQFSDLTRIRLRPAVYLWDGARFNLEYEIASLYFNGQNALLSAPLGKTKTQLVRLSWTPVNESSFRINHFIDRLYLKQNFNSGNIIVGRQRIFWGTGRTWNPTDLFNPNNPTNFSKIEKDGADVVSLNYYFGSFTDLNIVFNPNEKISNSNFAARFRTNVGEYDFSLMSGRFDKRIVVGLDFAGNLLTAGVRGEGIISINEENSSDNFIKFILGIDYQFTAELYALIEYHFNGEGKTDKQKYDVQKLASGEILNLNKNYLNISGTYQFSPLLSFGLSNIFNLNDGSGLTALTANYSIITDMYVNVGSQITYGTEFSEYWYYGSSFYIQLEYYF